MWRPVKMRGRRRCLVISARPSSRMPPYTATAFNGMSTQILHHSHRACGLTSAPHTDAIVEDFVVDLLMLRHRYGDYVNGERGKPLFVSLVLYLDEEWRREWDAGVLRFLQHMPKPPIRTHDRRNLRILRLANRFATETLFLNQSSGIGLFVQPRPGRVALLHQDVQHRLSTPSILARRPRCFCSNPAMPLTYLVQAPAILKSDP